MVSLCFKDYISNSEYVSDIMVTNDALVLCYKKKNRGWQQVINMSDIESVKVDFTADSVQRGKYRILECQTGVSIKIKNNKTVSFTQNPSGVSFKCPYAFMLDLLSVSSFLPNFSYNMRGNCVSVLEDIRHYEIYRKRLSFLKRMQIELKNTPPVGKVASVILIFCLIVPIGFMCYMFIPPFLTPEDKAYRSYIEMGYEYYRQDLYDLSLREYDKALAMHNDDAVLYYYRALSFYEKHDYQQAKQEAIKGLSFVKNKSTYFKTKNYRFLDNDKIGLYTTLAESEMEMGDFISAKNTYTTIIDQIKYRFTDAYFKRGLCEYHLGQKDAALTDFFKHKEIINDYIAEEEASEYKSKYPSYTEKDIENIDAWINACQNMP